jgi:hypothetical protein
MTNIYFVIQFYFMKETISFLMFYFFSQFAYGQNRVNKFSLNLLTNLYSYGEGQGHINNVVRLGEGVSITLNLRYGKKIRNDL